MLIKNFTKKKSPGPYDCTREFHLKTNYEVKELRNQRKSK